MSDVSVIKAIDKAFQFHPYGQNKPSVYGDWVMGPTFIVRVPDSADMAFAHLSNLWLTTPADEQAKLNAVLDKEKEVDLTVTLTPDKHISSPKCTYRMFAGAGNKFGLELGFPLVQLAKKIGVKTWKTINNDVGVLVFGYDSNAKFTGLFIARRVGLDHEEKA